MIKKLYTVRFLSRQFNYDFGNMLLGSKINKFYRKELYRNYGKTFKLFRKKLKFASPIQFHYNIRQQAIKYFYGVFFFKRFFDTEVKNAVYTSKSIPNKVSAFKYKFRNYSSVKSLLYKDHPYYRYLPLMNYLEILQKKRGIFNDLNNQKIIYNYIQSIIKERINFYLGKKYLKDIFLLGNNQTLVHNSSSNNFNNLYIHSRKFFKGGFSKDARNLASKLYNPLISMYKPNYNRLIFLLETSFVPFFQQNKNLLTNYMYNENPLYRNYTKFLDKLPLHANRRDFFVFDKLFFCYAGGSKLLSFFNLFKIQHSFIKLIFLKNKLIYMNNYFLKDSFRLYNLRKKYLYSNSKCNTFDFFNKKFFLFKSFNKSINSFVKKSKNYVPSEALTYFFKLLTLYKFFSMLKRLYIFTKLPVDLQRYLVLKIIKKYLTISKLLLFIIKRKKFFNLKKLNGTFMQKIGYIFIKKFKQKKFFIKNKDIAVTYKNKYILQTCPQISIQHRQLNFKVFKNLIVEPYSAVESSSSSFDRNVRAYLPEYFTSVTRQGKVLDINTMLSLRTLKLFKINMGRPKTAYYYFDQGKKYAIEKRLLRRRSQRFFKGSLPKKIYFYQKNLLEAWDKIASKVAKLDFEQRVVRGRYFWFKKALGFNKRRRNLFFKMKGLVLNNGANPLSEQQCKLLPFYARGLSSSEAVITKDSLPLTMFYFSRKYKGFGNIKKKFRLFQSFPNFKLKRMLLPFFLKTSIRRLFYNKLISREFVKNQPINYFWTTSNMTRSQLFFNKILKKSLKNKKDLSSFKGLYTNFEKGDLFVYSYKRQYTFASKWIRGFSASLGAVPFSYSTLFMKQKVIPFRFRKVLLNLRKPFGSSNINREKGNLIHKFREVNSFFFMHKYKEIPFLYNKRTVKNLLVNRLYTNKGLSTGFKAHLFFNKFKKKVGLFFISNSFLKFNPLLMSSAQALRRYYNVYYSRAYCIKNPAWSWKPSMFFYKQKRLLFSGDNIKSGLNNKVFHRASEFLYSKSPFVLSLFNLKRLPCIFGRRAFISNIFKKNFPKNLKSGYSFRSQRKKGSSVFYKDLNFFIVKKILVYLNQQHFRKRFGQGYVSNMKNFLKKKKTTRFLRLLRIPRIRLRKGNKFFNIVDSSIFCGNFYQKIKVASKKKVGKRFLKCEFSKLQIKSKFKQKKLSSVGKNIKFFISKVKLNKSKDPKIYNKTLKVFSGFSPKFCKVLKGLEDDLKYPWSFAVKDSEELRARGRYLNSFHIVKKTNNFFYKKEWQNARHSTESKVFFERASRVLNVNSYKYAVSELSNPTWKRVLLWRRRFLRIQRFKNRRKVRLTFKLKKRLNRFFNKKSKKPVLKRKKKNVLKNRRFSYSQRFKRCVKFIRFKYRNYASSKVKNKLILRKLKEQNNLLVIHKKKYYSKLKKKHFFLLKTLSKLQKRVRFSVGSLGRMLVRSFKTSLKSGRYCLLLNCHLFKSKFQFSSGFRLQRIPLQYKKRFFRKRNSLVVLKKKQLFLKRNFFNKLQPYNNSRFLLFKNKVYGYKNNKYKISRVSNESFKIKAPYLGLAFFKFMGGMDKLCSKELRIFNYSFRKIIRHFKKIREIKALRKLKKRNFFNHKKRNNFSSFIHKFNKKGTSKFINTKRLFDQKILVKRKRRLFHNKRNFLGKKKRQNRKRSFGLLFDPIFQINKKKLLKNKKKFFSRRNFFNNKGRFLRKKKFRNKRKYPLFNNLVSGYGINFLKALRSSFYRKIIGTLETFSKSRLSAQKDIISMRRNFLLLKNKLILNSPKSLRLFKSFFGMSRESLLVSLKQSLSKKLFKKVGIFTEQNSLYYLKRRVPLLLLSSLQYSRFRLDRFFYSNLRNNSKLFNMLRYIKYRELCVKDISNLRKTKIQKFLNFIRNYSPTLEKSFMNQFKVVRRLLVPRFRQGFQRGTTRTKTKHVYKIKVKKRGGKFFFKKKGISVKDPTLVQSKQKKKKLLDSFKFQDKEEFSEEERKRREDEEKTRKEEEEKKRVHLLKKKELLFSRKLCFLKGCVNKITKTLCSLRKSIVILRKLRNRVGARNFISLPTYSSFLNNFLLVNGGLTKVKLNVAEHLCEQKILKLKLVRWKMGINNIKESHNKFYFKFGRIKKYLHYKSKLSLNIRKRKFRRFKTRSRLLWFFMKVKGSYDSRRGLLLPKKYKRYSKFWLSALVNKKAHLYMKWFFNQHMRNNAKFRVKFLRNKYVFGYKYNNNLVNFLRKNVLKSFYKYKYYNHLFYLKKKYIINLLNKKKELNSAKVGGLLYRTNTFVPRGIMFRNIGIKNKIPLVLKENLYTMRRKYELYFLKLKFRKNLYYFRKGFTNYDANFSKRFRYTFVKKKKKKVFRFSLRDLVEQQNAFASRGKRKKWRSKRRNYDRKYSLVRITRFLLFQYHYGLNRCELKKLYNVTVRRPLYDHMFAHFCLNLNFRLNILLHNLFFFLNLKEISQHIRHGHVLVNGFKVKSPNFIIKSGDIVDLSKLMVHYKFKDKYVQLLKNRGFFKFYNVLPFYVDFSFLSYKLLVNKELFLRYILRLKNTEISYIQNFLFK